MLVLTLPPSDGQARCCTGSCDVEAEVAELDAERALARAG